MSGTTTNPSDALPAKETRAQRTERLKLEKDPWQALEDIRNFARQGRDSVLPAWAGLYFKWWGIYTQGDGIGAVGGKDGEGKSTAYFMMRIAMPNGLLTSHQLRTIAGLAERHARGVADITVRQNIQLHWLTIESLPEVIDALDALGLSPKGACGDVVRNVTGCPLAGRGRGRNRGRFSLCARDLASAALQSRFLQPPAQIQNLHHRLPRLVLLPGDQRYRPHGGRAHPRRPARDRLLPARRRRPFRRAAPLRAPRRLRPPRSSPAVVRAITEIFRDAEQGLRENRKRARMKYLFMHVGWTPKASSRN